MAPSWLTGSVSTFSRRANTTGPSKPAYGAGTDRRSATTSPTSAPSEPSKKQVMATYLNHPGPILNLPAKASGSILGSD